MAPEKCALCGSPLDSLRSGDNRLYHQCGPCDWIVLDGAHHLPVEGQRARYLQHENSSDSAGYVKMLEGFIERGVAPYAPPGGRILDFGSGPEPVLAGILRRMGYPTDIYDLFFHPEESYRSQTYNLITLTEVLEHLSNPLEILRGLSQRLKPGGVLAVMTLFHPANPEAFNAWWYRRDPTHVSFFTERTIRRLAEMLNAELLFTDHKRISALRL